MNCEGKKDMNINSALFGCKLQFNLYANFQIPLPHRNQAKYELLLLYNTVVRPQIKDDGGKIIIDHK